MERTSKTGVIDRTWSLLMSVGMGVTSLGMSDSCRLGMQLSASGASGVSCEKGL